jgi:hypothetical protein
MVKAETPALLAMMCCCLASNRLAMAVYSPGRHASRLNRFAICTQGSRSCVLRRCPARDGIRGDAHAATRVQGHYERCRARRGRGPARFDNGRAQEPVEAARDQGPQQALRRRQGRARQGALA